MQHLPPSMPPLPSPTSTSILERHLLPNLCRPSRLTAHRSTMPSAAGTNKRKAGAGGGAAGVLAKRVTKMQRWLDWRVRVTIDSNNRTIVGNLLAFDRYMNLVLQDSEEFRIIAGKGGKPDREQKRALNGVVVLRGEQVLSICPEAPPSTLKGATGAGAGAADGGVPAGNGVATAVGRGVGLGAAAAGLSAAPVPGMGAPAAAQMRPGAQ